MFTFATIVLNFEITDVDRKLKATFSSKTAGIVLPSLTIGPPMPLQPTTITEGTPVDFSTTKGVELKDFAGKVEVGQSPGVGVSVLSTGGDFVFSFEEMATAKHALTRPTVVSVNAGQGLGTLPSAGFGAGTTGTMSMQGAVKPVN
jgi:hypothetical protein